MAIIYRTITTETNNVGKLIKLLSTFLWHNKRTVPTQYLFFLISNLQFIMFLILGQFAHVSSRTEDTYSTFIKEITQIVSYTRLIENIVENEFAVGMVTACGVYLAILILITVLNVWSPFSGREKQILANILSKIAYLHFSIGFLLVDVILMGIINQLQTSPLENQQKNDALLISSIILVVWNNIFGFIASIFSFDPFLSGNVFGCRSPSFQAVLLVGKAAIVPIVIFSDWGAKWVIVAIIGLAVTFLRHATLILDFPFYNFKGMKWAIIFNNLIGFFSLCLLIVSIVFRDNDLNSKRIIYCQTVAVPLIIKLSLIDYSTKINHYLSTSDENLRDEKQALKKCLAISHIMNNKVFELQKDNFNLIYKFNIINEHNQSCAITDCPCKFILWKESNSGISPLGQTDIPSVLSDNIILNLLTEASKKIQNNTNLLIALAFLQINLKAEQKALYSLQTIPSQNSFLTKLIITRLKSRIQHHLHAKYDDESEGMLNMKNFVEYHSIVSGILDKMTQVSQSHLEFWRTYEKPDFTITKMLNKNYKVEKEAAELDELWGKYEKQFGINSYYLYPKYALFLLGIRNAPYSAEKLMKRYRKKVFSNKHIDPQGELTNVSLQDRDNIVVCISMGKKNPGSIIEITSNIENLGWKQQEVLGRTISHILPPFFQEHEMLFMNNLMEVQAKYKILDSTFPCFLRTKEGVAIPCNVHLALNPYISDQVTYIAVFRLKRNNTQYVLLRRNGEIDCTTQEIGAELHLGNTRCHISSICPTASYMKLTSRTTTESEKYYQHATSFLDDRQLLSLHPYVPHGTLTTLSGREKKTKDYLVKSSEMAFKEAYIKVLELSPFGGDMDEEKEKQQKEVAISQKSMGWTPPESEHNVDRSFNFEFSQELAEDKVDNIATHLFHTRTLNETLRLNTVGERITTIGERQGTIADRLKTFERVPTFNERSFATEDRLMTKEYNNFTTEKSEIIYGDLRLANNPGSQLVKTTAEIKTQNELRPPSEPMPTPKDLRMISSHDFVSFGDENAEYQHHLNIAHSVQSSSTKVKLHKVLEEAVYSVPAQKSALVLNFCAIAMFILTGGLLVHYFLYAKGNFNEIKNNMETMEQTTGLLARSLEVYKFFKWYNLTSSGLFPPMRTIGYPADGPEIDAYVWGVLLSLENKSDMMQESLKYVDKGYKEIIFDNNIPIVEDHTDGISRNSNLFEVTNQIIVSGRKYVNLTTLVPFNRDALFIQENTLNDYLVRVEDVSVLLLKDIQIKIEDSFNQNIKYLIVVAVVGILFLILFAVRERKFIKQKSHFLNLLSMMDDKFVERHLIFVSEAIPLIKTNDQNENSVLKVYQRIIEDKTDPSMKKLPTKLDFKKLISLKGLNRHLIATAFLMVLFIALLVSAFLFIHILFVSSGRRNNLLNFIEMEFNTSYSYYELKLLSSTIYDYIQYNGTTEIRKEPIGPEWERIYGNLVNFQEFLSEISEEYTNTTVKELIFDDLCEKLFNVTDGTCAGFAGGAVTRGIIGMNSYLLQVLRRTKDEFDISPRGILNMYLTMNTIDLFYGEFIDLLFMISAYEVLIDTQIFETNEKVDSASKDIITIIVIFIVVDAVIGIMLWMLISRNIQKERTNWMKIMRRVPFNLVRTSKVLKSYLNKNKNVHFT